MQYLLQLSPRLLYKIILPFLMLTLLIGLIGVGISFYFVAETVQSEFNSQLIDVARTVNDIIVVQERKNLQFLREVSFAPENPSTGTPAVANALQDGDIDGLHKAITPYFNLALADNDIHIDRMIAFDKSGKSVLDIGYLIDEHGEPIYDGHEPMHRLHEPTDFSQQKFVQNIVSGKKDDLGDKFAGLMTLPDEEGNEQFYFFTSAPVFSTKQPQDVVGGIIAATRIDGGEHSLLRSISASAKADFVAVYDASGKAQFASNAPMEGVDDSRITESHLSQALNGGTILDTINKPDTKWINGEEYQIVYSSLVIRSEALAVIGVALNRSDINQNLRQAQLPVIGITFAIMFGVTVLGYYISRTITTPLEELAMTAQAVTEGDLARRSNIKDRDEIGSLAQSFNRMTEYLLGYMSRLVNISSQRAAIVESLGEGVVVCDQQGTIKLINSATRRLLNLDDDAPAPAHFSDLPLTPLATDGNERVFDNQLDDFYNLGNYIVRLQESPVYVHNEMQGSVYVLQDMTAEVNIDRARTTFIATISHEMRTPLTPLRANMDMLRSGMAGTLNDQQRAMVEDLSQQVLQMSTLIDNMTVIAGLDSGATKVVPEPTDLKTAIDKGIWPLRKAVKNKGLTLTVTVPPDMPPVLADFIQLRTIVKHLVDNAVKYTDSGFIQITAVREISHVRVDVCDSGCGIAPEMHEKIFERLVRDEGDKSNERSIRGIGLGLAIVKQLVEMHRGTVWVESEPDKGSTFSFTLPYADASDDSDGSADISSAA